MSCPYRCFRVVRNFVLIKLLFKKWYLWTRLAVALGWLMNGAWYTFGLFDIRETDMDDRSCYHYIGVNGAGIILGEVVMYSANKYVKKYLSQALDVLQLTRPDEQLQVVKDAVKAGEDGVGTYRWDGNTRDAESKPGVRRSRSSMLVKRSFIADTDAEEEDTSPKGCVSCGRFQELRRIRTLTAVACFGIWLYMAHTNWRRLFKYVVDSERMEQPSWLFVFLIVTCTFWTVSVTMILGVLGSFGIMLWLINKPFERLAERMKLIGIYFRAGEQQQQPRAGSTTSVIQREQFPWTGLRRQYELANNGVDEFSKAWRYVIVYGMCILLTLVLVFFDAGDTEYLAITAGVIGLAMLLLSYPSSMMKRTKRQILRIVELDDYEMSNGLHEFKMMAYNMASGLSFGNFVFSYESSIKMMYIMFTLVLVVLNHADQLEAL